MASQPFLLSSKYGVMKKLLFAEKLRESVQRSLKAINEESLADALAAEGDEDALPAPDEDLVDALDAEEVETPEMDAGALGDAEAVQQTIKDYQNENNDIIMGWIKKLDEFVNFVNSPTYDGGIKASIDKAIQGSVFEKIKTSEARSLTRTAKEAAALSQALRSYVNAPSTEIKTR